MTASRSLGTFRVSRDVKAFLRNHTGASVGHIGLWGYRSGSGSVLDHALHHQHRGETLDSLDFRSTGERSAHASIVEAIYSPKLSSSVPKCWGARSPKIARVRITRPCGTELLSEEDAKIDRRFHWGAIKSPWTRSDLPVGKKAHLFIVMLANQWNRD